MRRLLGALAALSCLYVAPQAFAQADLAQAVSACGTPNNAPVTGNNYPITANGSGVLCVSGTFTPSGTTDTNLKQVNGATVNVGTGAASTGTQRVTTSTDSTIGTVTAVTAITNALPAGTNVIGHVIVDTTSTTAVTQATAANLNATVVGTGTFAVQNTPAVSAITGSVSAATITNSSTQVVAAASRKLLVVDNESATASIACAFGATAALNTAGSFTIPPLNTRVWSAYPVPADAVNCISSVASSPATVEAN